MLNAADPCDNIDENEANIRICFRGCQKVLVVEVVLPQTFALLHQYMLHVLIFGCTFAHVP
jgi:hypothetical protein